PSLHLLAALVAEERTRGAVREVERAICAQQENADVHHACERAEPPCRRRGARRIRGHAARVVSFTARGGKADVVLTPTRVSETATTRSLRRASAGTSVADSHR